LDGPSPTRPGTRPPRPLCLPGCGHFLDGPPPTQHGRGRGGFRARLGTAGAILAPRRPPGLIYICSNLGFCRRRAPPRQASGQLTTILVPQRPTALLYICSNLGFFYREAPPKQASGQLSTRIVPAVPKRPLILPGSSAEQGVGPPPNEGSSPILAKRRPLAQNTLRQWRQVGPWPH
jgi:hypothetical protein